MSFLFSLTRNGRYLLTTLTLPLILLTTLFITLNQSHPTQASSHILFVDTDAPGPTQDGHSWATAYTTLQAALLNATSGDQIWVAEGVYYPDEGGTQTDNDRTATFQLINGVTLYGGFAATETAVTQRNWQTHITILSGDIDNNDIDPTNIVTDTANLVGNNSYHVVTGSGTDHTAGLDGFTITGGRANSTFPNQRGAGLVNLTGHPTLNQLHFIGNHANSQGGALYNLTSTPLISDVTFSHNYAHSGGALYNWTSSPTLTHVTFNHNSAFLAGGALYNNSGSNPTLTRLTFNHNSVVNGDGGALYNNQSDPLISYTTFNHNNSFNDGGAIFNSRSHPTIDHAIFYSNTTSNGNGAGLLQ